MKVFILILLIIISISSNEIKSKVDIQKPIVQLGVFKDMANIEKLKKKFTNLNLFVKQVSNETNKLFIINIKDEDLTTILENIRTIIPNAFILSSARKNIIFNNLKPCLATPPPKNPKPLQIKAPIKSIITYEDSSCLDSTAIIKTREKFFK